jgi:hypothetical protein
MINPLILLADFLGFIPSCWFACGIIWLLITVGCVIYVWNDCHRGNIPGIGWTILAAVLGFIGLIIYLIYKTTQPDRGWRG